MENLTVFYRILNEDLSPLISPTSSDIYFNYLKERYPEYVRQIIIRLDQSKNGYKISEMNEQCFWGTVPIHSIVSEYSRNASDVLNFVLNKLAIDSNKILNHSVSNDNLQINLKLSLRADYEKLSENEAKFYYYQVMLQEVCTITSKKLLEKVYKTENEDKISLHIKKYQSLIIRYMKTILEDYIPKEHWNSLFQTSTGYTTTDIFKITYQALEEILVYLEKSFDNYLDTNLPVPYQNRLLLALEHNEKLSRVYKMLEQAKLDYRLHELVVIPFEQIGMLEPLSFTYHNHAYHKAYLLAFYQAALKNELPDDKKVILILWQLNFNALKFFNYLTKTVYQELKTRDIPEEKLGLLYYYQKLCNQQPVKTKLTYNPNLLPLKDQMSIWLQEEISFLKRNLKYNTNRIPGDHGNTTKKTLVKMSVPQLSLFTRAIFESGLVDGSRQAILTFICQNFRTAQQENISVGSIKGKYYKVDTSTKRSVGRVVKKMLVQIESAGKNY
jgi:hypothetical protein